MILFYCMILGMKVRKHDLEDMLKFNSKILEFHFSDSDLNMTLDTNFDKQLMVHCYEYFDRKIVDMVSFKETNQIHSKEKSIELIQAAIDKTKELGEHFIGTPSIIVHPGGYSLEELNSEKIEQEFRCLNNIDPDNDDDEYDRKWMKFKETIRYKGFAALVSASFVNL